MAKREPTKLNLKLMDCKLIGTPEEIRRQMERSRPAKRLFLGDLGFDESEIEEMIPEIEKRAGKSKDICNFIDQKLREKGIEQ